MFDWQKLISEMSSHCPLLFQVAQTVIGCTPKENIEKIAPRLGLCYAVMMQTRKRELSLVQRLNMILLAEGNAKKKVNSYCFPHVHV